jgi:nicotinate-nucleotide adenylyltransferase
MRPKTEDIIDLLRYSVSPARFAHSKRVADCCGSIARSYALDVEKCVFAGWAHDIAREWSPEALLQFARRNDSEGIDPVEAQNPKLLHGHVGSIVISRELGVEDECIIEAVRYHTLGKADFCPFGRVLYCADYLEPARPGVPDKLRRSVAVVPLDELVRMIITDTRRRGYSLSDRTEAMYRSVLQESSRG